MNIQVAKKRLTLSEQLQEARLAASESQAQLTDLRAQQLFQERELEVTQAEAERLRGQLSELENLREQVTKLTKDLESAKNTSKWSNERATKAESELEQAHAVLDGVAGAPAREYEQEYGKGRRDVVSRLAGAFLAIAQKRGV